MKQVHLRLPEYLACAIETHAKKTGNSENAVIRHCIDFFFQNYQPRDGTQGDDEER